MNTMKTLTVLAIAVSALATAVGSSEAMTRGGSGFRGHGPVISKQFGSHRISCFACNLPRGGQGGYRNPGWNYGNHGWGYGNHGWGYGYHHRDYGNYWRYGYGKPWRYGYFGREWNRWYYWPRPVIYSALPAVEPVAATPVAPLATPAVLAPAPVADAPVEAPAPAPAPAAAVTCTAAPGGAVTCSAVTPPVADAR